MSPALKLSPKPIDFREADFKREVNAFIKYPPDMRAEFIDYWSEPDRAALPRMRFEKEKTWDLSRRLARWAKTDFGKTGRAQAQVISMVKKQPDIVPKSDIEVLDQLLERYISAHAGDITIETLKTWSGLQVCYAALKRERLWCPEITKQEIDLYKTEIEIKSFIVIRTLDWYGAKGWRFSDTLKSRK